MNPVKLQDKKINIKNLLCLYTDSELSEREIMKTASFTSKRIKWPWNKFYQGGERPVHWKRWDINKRNWRIHKSMERYSGLMDWKN